MGVDAAGGLQHLPLCFTAQRPQGLEGLGGGPLCRAATHPGTGFKIGVEGGGAVHEGKDVHILVAAAVPPVYKAGLRGGRHLIQQSADRQTGRVGDVLRIPGVGQDLGGFFLQFCHGVDAAAAAHLGWPAADQAAAPLKMQLLPVHLPPIRADDVHIKEPPQRCGVLDVGGELFDGQRVGVQHIERLAARDLPDGVLPQWHQLRPQELLTQQLTPPRKAPPDEG